MGGGEGEDLDISRFEFFFISNSKSFSRLNMMKIKNSLGT
jgi:hypothetical protein